MRHGAQTKIVSPLFGQAQADQPSPELGHEVDGFRGDKLRRKRKVSLVLTILVVDDDDHAAGLELLQGARYVGKGSLCLHDSIVRQMA